MCAYGRKGGEGREEGRGEGERERERKEELMKEEVLTKESSRSVGLLPTTIVFSIDFIFAIVRFDESHFSKLFGDCKNEK